MSARFQVLEHDQGGSARAGVLQTAHGAMHTPTFMPVGTQAALKGLTPSDARGVGAQCILANTYHLWERPGQELIRQAGGLHSFMGWQGPILTDSGGFQLLSLRALARIEEEGATISSPVDGTDRLLTPEVAMEVQADLGSDIAMALDVCSPHPSTASELSELVEATERTGRWAERSLNARHATGQAIFGIVQGGVELELRRRSARRIASLEFDGYAIGGLSIGEERIETWPALDAAVAALPSDSPRYLMGVGAPADLIDGIARGVDMFDSVFPTRLGRRGSVFTTNGRQDLRAAAAASRLGPIDPTCDCVACADYSVGYLHHLLRSGEDLGLRLASLHNVRFLLRLTELAREAILERRFAEFATTFSRGSSPPSAASPPW